MVVGVAVQVEDNDVPQAGPLPPPTTAPKLELPSGTMATVRSPSDLTKAFRRQVLDIEIQEHLDLRGMQFAHNPTLTRKACRERLGVPGGGCDFLLYLDNIRSIRGNCSGPPKTQYAQQLILPGATVNAIDHVAQGQCVIIIDRPTFQAVSGNKWFDNLYFVTLPYEGSPQLAPTAISVSPFQREAGMNLFLTNMTFHGAGPDAQSRALAVEADVRDIAFNLGRLVNAPYKHSILVQESRFLNYGGIVPPVLISGESFGTFQNCSFENFRLPRELFDVSFGGMLHLDTCSFKDVSLLSPKPKLVSTTANNYIACSGDVVDQTVDISRTPQAVFFNYADDDDEYDILGPHLHADNLTSGVIVDSATISDCLRLDYACPRIATPIKGENYTSIIPAHAPPGCPVSSSIAKRHELLQTRCQSDFFQLDVSENDFMPSDGQEELQAQIVIAGEQLNLTNGTLRGDTAQLEADRRAALEAEVEQACLGYGSASGTQGTRDDGYVYGFLEPDHPWLSAVRNVLPEYSHDETDFWSWPCVRHCPEEPTATATMNTPVVAERPANVTIGDMSNTSHILGAAIGSAVAFVVLVVASIALYMFALRKPRSNPDSPPHGLRNEGLPVSVSAGDFHSKDGGQSRAFPKLQPVSTNFDTFQRSKSGLMLNSPSALSSCTSGRVQSMSLNFITPIDVQNPEIAVYTAMDPQIDLEAVATTAVVTMPRTFPSRLPSVAKDHSTKLGSRHPASSGSTQSMMSLVSQAKAPEVAPPAAVVSTSSAYSWFKAFCRAPAPGPSPMLHMQTQSTQRTRDLPLSCPDTTSSQPPEAFSSSYNDLPEDEFAVDLSTADSSMYAAKVKIVPLLSPAGPPNSHTTGLSPLGRTTAQPSVPTVTQGPAASARCTPAGTSAGCAKASHGSADAGADSDDDPFAITPTNQQAPHNPPRQVHEYLWNSTLSTPSADPIVPSRGAIHNSALSTADAAMMNSQHRHGPHHAHLGPGSVAPQQQIHPSILAPKIQGPPSSGAAPAALTFQAAATTRSELSALSSQMVTATPQVSQIMQTFERSESGGSVGPRPPTGAPTAMIFQPSGAMSRVGSGEASSVGHSHHMIMDQFESDFGATMPDYACPTTQGPSHPNHPQATAAALAVGPTFRSPHGAASPHASSLHGQSHLTVNAVPLAAATGGYSLDMLAGGDSMWSEAAAPELKSLQATLTTQLDRFRPKHLMAGEYRLLGSNARKNGGQSVIQFARHRTGKSDVAIKFFLDPTAFYTEAQLYATYVPELRGCVVRPPAVMDTIDPTDTCDSSYRVESHQLESDAPTFSLQVQGGHFLPKVEAIYDIGAEGLEDPRGQRLPPCIIMEKGRSLEELLQLTAPNRLLILTILSNVSKRLAAMHEAGYAHRDIKPANVLWLPTEALWVPIDFGCAAKIGSRAPLTYSPTYAAPEVLHADELCAEVVEVFPEVDVWALGVLAFELLTGLPAPENDLNKAIPSMNTEDREPLPWESPLSSEVRHKLGPLQSLVLSALHYDPSQRPTMDTFHSIVYSFVQQCSLYL